MGFELDQVLEIVERVATSSGLEVVEVDLRGAGKARMLRIVIDKIGEPGAGDKPVGVTHEDCANLSREVGTISMWRISYPATRMCWRFRLRGWTASCCVLPTTSASRAAK